MDLWDTLCDLKFLHKSISKKPGLGSLQKSRCRSLEWPQVAGTNSSEVLQCSNSPELMMPCKTKVPCDDVPFCESVPWKNRFASCWMT